MSKRKKYIKSCEVSELCTLTLGGYDQKILIEGLKKDLPVVICLHGGPGSPVPFSVGCRGLFPEWTSKAVMVYWDQLGCGINNFKIADGFKIENFVDMTCDLVFAIKEKFPQNKLFLFGVSWGSILAFKTALCVPEKIDGVFVYGHVLKNLVFNEEVRAALSAVPAKYAKTVEKIFNDGPQCDAKILNENMQTLYKLLNKYTSAYFNKNSKPVSIAKIAIGLMRSPDYLFKDFKAVMNNGYKDNESLWKELLQIDLTEELKKISVPYLILQGDTDVITSTKNVAEAVRLSANGNVKLKILKNSGHMPSEDAMAECFKTLLEFIQ